MQFVLQSYAMKYYWWSSSEIAGRAPVAYVQKVTVLLSAKASEQKILLTWPSDDSSSKGMMVGPCVCMLFVYVVLITPFEELFGFGIIQMIFACSFVVFLGLVLRIPVLGRFILPFDIAGEDGRYFLTLSAVINEQGRVYAVQDLRRPRRNMKKSSI